MVIITGGSSGIGLEVARKLLSTEDNILIGDISAPAIKGPNVSYVKLDVTDSLSVDNFFKSVPKDCRKIKGLVHCAGVAIFEPFIGIDESTWDHVIDTNLKGSFLILKQAVTILKRMNGGRIINIGSVADHQILDNCAAYGASKFALRCLNDTIAKEHRVDNIFCTLFSLGAVNTPLWDGSGSNFDLSKMLDPVKVAEKIVDVLYTPLAIDISHIEISPSAGVL